MSQVLIPLPSKCLEDIDTSGDTYKDENENKDFYTFIFDPVINKGIVKLEVLDVQDIYSVGIADESVRYCRNEMPEARGWDKHVCYRWIGDIRHIGDYIEGNSCFRNDGYRIQMELNMDSNPRTLTFFVNDEEQKNFIINIPKAVRIWCCVYEKGASFKIPKFEFLSKPTAKHGFFSSKKWEYGKEWKK
ncbi:MAG: hypothetical protein EZS28_030721 [Streblomastix strix]|uniref:SPRY domain-containing protein n=1 Tax=Streblomastix strix TaxID=222440 RepID=A0A5J4UV83_9EUKA|nr:MAG: hypothetical protein EZS28_030721 [Streblomastix strix]